MNILMAVNQNYFLQMLTLLCSLGENNSSKIDVYLIHNELTAKHIQLVQNMMKEKNYGCVYEIKVDSTFLEGAKVNEHFSIEMYYRIYASELLPKEIDRILWLDADIVTIKSIEGLYHTDLQGNSIAACVHRERFAGCDAINDRAVKRLEMDPECRYFNSGVLLMDLKKIRENFQKEAVTELIYQKESVLENPDQDILNLLYCHDVLLLDESVYNYQVHYDWDAVNEQQHVLNNVVILHFVGPAKPWKPDTMHFTYDYYWRYYLVHGSKANYEAYKVKYILVTIVRSIKLFIKKLLRKA